MVLGVKVFPENGLWVGRTSDLDGPRDKLAFPEPHMEAEHDHVEDAFPLQTAGVSHFHCCVAFGASWFEKDT